MNVIKSVTFTVIAAMSILSMNSIGTEAAMTQEQITKIMTTMSTNCAGKVGLSPELLAAHRNHEFPPERDLMCYLYCLEKTGKLIDKNDKIDLETAIKTTKIAMPEHLREGQIRAYTECAPKATSEDPCEMAWQYAKCYYDTDPESYTFL